MLSATELHSIPEPLDVPSGLERMIKGVHLSTEGSPQILADSFFDVFVPYEDGVEGKGWLIDIANPKWMPVVESTLRPFFYNPLDGMWKDLTLFGGTYSLDMVQVSPAGTHTAPAVGRSLCSPPSHVMVRGKGIACPLWLGYAAFSSSLHLSTAVAASGA